MADSTISSTTPSTVSSLIQSQYQQPSITFSGLGSNIDTTSMITQLVKAESGQLNQLETWRDQWTTKITALQDLNTKLTDLRTTIQAMDTQAQFQNKITSVSNESVLSATTSAGAASGNHQVLVNSLAQNEVQVHLGLAGSDTVINSSGTTQVFAFSYAGGASVSIQVPDGTTLSGLAQLINTSGANQGVTATVLDMGSSYTTDRYRLMLTGNDTGAANTVTVDNNLTTLNGSGGTANFTSTGFTVPPPQAAQNAQVRLDGYPPNGWVERPGNTIADLIPGVTLNLFQPSTTAVQITTTDDTSAMQTEITTFVDQYNDLLSYIQEQTKYDKTSGQAGVLLGNYAVQITKSQLNAIATGNAPGFADGKDAYLNLAQIGITTDPDETSPTFGQLDYRQRHPVQCPAVQLPGGGQPDGGFCRRQRRHHRPYQLLQRSPGHYPAGHLPGVGHGVGGGAHRRHHQRPRRHGGRQHPYRHQRQPGIRAGGAGKSCRRHLHRHGAPEAGSERPVEQQAGRPVERLLGTGEHPHQ